MGSQLYSYSYYHFHSQALEGRDHLREDFDPLLDRRYRYRHSHDIRQSHDECSHRFQGHSSLFHNVSGSFLPSLEQQRQRTGRPSSSKYSESFVRGFEQDRQSYSEQTGARTSATSQRGSSSSSSVRHIALLALLALPEAYSLSPSRQAVLLSSGTSRQSSLHGTVNSVCGNQVARSDSVGSHFRDTTASTGGDCGLDQRTKQDPAQGLIYPIDSRHSSDREDLGYTNTDHKPSGDRINGLQRRLKSVRSPSIRNRRKDSVEIVTPLTPALISHDIKEKEDKEESTDDLNQDHEDGDIVTKTRNDIVADDKENSISQKYPYETPDSFRRILEEDTNSDGNETLANESTASEIHQSHLQVQVGHYTAHSNHSATRFTRSRALEPGVISQRLDSNVNSSSYEHKYEHQTAESSTSTITADTIEQSDDSTLSSGVQPSPKLTQVELERDNAHDHTQVHDPEQGILAARSTPENSISTSTSTSTSTQTSPSTPTSSTPASSISDVSATNLTTSLMTNVSIVNTFRTSTNGQSTGLIGSTESIQEARKTTGITGACASRRGSRLRRKIASMTRIVR